MLKRTAALAGEKRLVYQMLVVGKKYDWLTEDLVPVEDLLSSGRHDEGGWLIERLSVHAVLVSCRSNIRGIGGSWSCDAGLGLVS